MSAMTDAQVALMASSNSAADWQNNLEQVQKEHDGQYPDDWYAKIIESGLVRRVATKFGQTGDIAIISAKPTFGVNEVKQHGRRVYGSYTPPVLPKESRLVMILNNGLRLSAYDVTDSEAYDSLYKRYADGHFLTCDLYEVGRGVVDKCYGASPVPRPRD